MTSMTETTHGLWGATAIAAPKTAALLEDQETDVAVIGAGFTGLVAALVLRSRSRLTQP